MRSKASVCAGAVSPLSLRVSSLGQCPGRVQTATTYRHSASTFGCGFGVWHSSSDYSAFYDVPARFKQHNPVWSLVAMVHWGWPAIEFRSTTRSPGASAERSRVCQRHAVGGR